MFHCVVSACYVTHGTFFEHFFDQEWVGFVANFEDVFAIYVTKTIVSGLEIVQSLSHIALGCEDYRLETIVGVGNLRGSGERAIL